MMRLWGGGPDGHGGRGGRGFGPMGGNIDMEALLAEQLGVSVDELNAAEDKVFADELAAAVANGDLTQEQADLMAAQHAFQRFLAPRMEQAYSDALTAAVEEGILTQEQADLLESMVMHGGRFGRWGMEPGFPGGRGHGGHGHDDYGSDQWGGMMPGSREGRGGRGHH